MIEGCYRYMDEEGFEKAKPEVMGYLNAKFPEAEIDLRFDPCMIACEDTSRIYVLVDSEHYLEVRGAWMSDDMKIFEQGMEEKYGDHSYMFSKVVDECETEAEIGDFIVIDNEYDFENGEEQVALVVSVLRNGDEKCYGCSHINVSFRKFSSCDDPIELTGENYSGYITAFKKKLSKEEAIAILRKNSGISYKSTLERLAEDKECVDREIESLINEVGGKSEKLQVEKMSIDGWWCRTKVDSSLKNNAVWSKDEDI